MTIKIISREAATKIVVERNNKRYELIVTRAAKRTFEARSPLAATTRIGQGKTTKSAIRSWLDLTDEEPLILEPIAIVPT